MELKEKRIVGRYLREKYEYIDGRSVRFDKDGSVYIMVDKMPNTDQPGRIFAGWDTELLQEAMQ